MQSSKKFALFCSFTSVVSVVVLSKQLLLQWTTALAIVTLPHTHIHTVYLISEGSVPGAASRLLYAAVLWSMGLASVALP